jgi:phospholipase/carboxylesterase
VLADVVFGAPLERARVIALLLHGRNQDPAFMDEHVVRRLALPHVAYVAPAAPERSWYPAGFMAPIADNEPRLSQALERVARLADELAAPLVVIGFSQGACLACEHVYRRGARALIAFTGGLIGPSGTTWRDSGELAGMPVLISGSDADAWVPVGRMRETGEVFTRLGARVATQFYPGSDHAVSDGELAAARALLAELGA